MAPGYLEEMFTYNTAEYSLRSTDAQNLLLPKARLEIFRKSFQYSGPKIWNSIPLHIRNCKSLRPFKEKCFTHVYTS